MLMGGLPKVVSWMDCGHAQCGAVLHQSMLPAGFSRLTSKKLPVRPMHGGRQTSLALNLSEETFATLLQKGYTPCAST
ncbi:hypothetical protein AMD24_00110 [Candidatus Xiphinematobacter sp. Idaho Grape]|nr:hypothetical protein AMD24_00110 [Candidatus Xiphinematobacter sp. Idaho Grape]